MRFKNYAYLLPVAFILSGCVGDQSASGTSSSATILDAVMNAAVMRSGGAQGSSALNLADIALGLKEALNVGTNTVVGQLGKTDGFNLDPKIHIPLPGTLAKVHSALSAVGMGGMTQDLELRLNRAAEHATPKAKALFFHAISQMTFDDARQILNGPNDAATQFLRRTMGAELAKEISPVVQNAMQSAGAVQAYDRVMGQYAALPFMPDVKTDLQNYVVEKSLDGIFYYVAQEEAAIRTNPAKRTTELLKKVFGAVR